MIYLASRYSDQDPFVQRNRFLVAEQVTAQKIEEGFFIYSPIVHCHEMAVKYAFRGDFDFWREYNIDMIRRADEFWILDAFTWQNSKGVIAEFEFAKSCGLEIKLVSVEGQVRAWLP